jgi:hypothetical protein
MSFAAASIALRQTDNAATAYHLTRDDPANSLTRLQSALKR